MVEAYALRHRVLGCLRLYQSQVVRPSRRKLIHCVLRAMGGMKRGASTSGGGNYIQAAHLVFGVWGPHVENHACQIAMCCFLILPSNPVWYTHVLEMCMYHVTLV